MVGGHLALLVDPDVLDEVAAGRRIAVVTGTNGKTTTTAMLRACLATQGDVACNDTGANMPAGIVTALLQAPTTSMAVLEVDEVYLEAVCTHVDPSVLVLLNLSREFTRGVSLSRTREVIAAALAGLPEHAAVVANADDPNVVALLAQRPEVAWVSGGEVWTEQFDLCPHCGIELVDRPSWRCPVCRLARPTPSWEVHDASLHHDGRELSLRELEGAPWLASNAAFALAAASHLGIDPAAAVPAVAAVGDVDGRYRRYEVEGRSVRVAMWKNPASLVAALNAVPPDAAMVVMTDRFGIKDTVSWWDVELPPRHGPTVVSGSRALDVAARLETAGVGFDVVEAPLDAIRSCREGQVMVVANYPALLRLKKLLKDYVA